jgi:hypothetical protein
MRAPDGIGEIEGQSPAGELDLVVGDRRNVAHLMKQTA